MSTYIDNTACLQVIGSVYNNPTLLDDDKLFFNEDDFVEKFHKIVFGAIYNLYLLGVKQININTIEDYLKDKPKSYAIYQANKGADWLNRVAAIVQVSTFQYYYQRMKKMTLFRMYDKIGMDLSWLYDNDNILDLKKKEKQDEWLDNTSIDKIADLIDGKIADVRAKYVNDDYSVSIQAGSGAIELLERLKVSPEFGVPLYGPLINTVTRGARLGKFYLQSAGTGTGKALPNSTKIPTPQGEKLVGEIKVGDYLFDAYGKPTQVKAIYPQGQKEVWEVKFKDGRIAKCCEEHLWSYCTPGQKPDSRKNRQFFTKTLKEINQIELYKKGCGYQVQVPMQHPVQYNEKQYYIKPYSFGLLLGDGSFRYNKNNKALTYSSENDILPSFIAKEQGWKYKKNSEFNYNWTFEYINNLPHTNVWVEEALKDYPKLWNCKSETKFIPQEYLEGSIEQRFDLLNGLLDSDGSVDSKGRICFWTVSPMLKDNVLQLCFSLGLKANYVIDTHKQNSLPCYVIHISGSPEIKVKLFKLPRKKELIQKWYNNNKRKETNDFNPIVEINKLNYTEEMTCFYVDNKEHLFLMNDYIVTHNTRSMIANACYIACQQMYDTQNRTWIEIGQKEPTLFITTEQDEEELQTMMIAFIAGINEEQIIKGIYTDDEWERVSKAAAILRESPLYIKKLPDFSLEDIEMSIKSGIREHGVKYVFHDYIHTSMKILGEISSKAKVKNLREDNILFMISVKLKDICTEYGIFIMSATQLNGDYRTAEVLDQNLLRGAKAIADKIDYGSIMLEATKKDLDALEVLLTNNGIPKPAIKISVYKNRRGKYKGILLWCREDRGQCKIEPMFATNYNYEFIEMEDTQIKITPSVTPINEPSAF